MPENKTQPTDAPVLDFISSVEPPRRREDAATLDQIFRDVTGWAPRMWGPSIVGYGSYHYVYDSGREGDMCATGFSPRKSNLVLYIMPGYADYADILANLGKHKLGKSCLYLNKIDDVDQSLLGELIRRGLDDLAQKWPVIPS
ncbi:DUF1801 domain-containing protein [Maritimibacter dapengensis]|uniref:DUF1801 domain-containing protein n=1 Tax=Maritimibacter dapengensis TaxID=2836868 RepID=A0ABS6T5U7_9RHOB|nr:DUF1801 domain-containing protein [Maritimibacter dapengensis]MBV7380647.1 DUF1801 domain-containing protein [Maritimibacter dapengensis]